MKTPIERLQEELEKLTIELSATKEELASTKDEVRNLRRLLIGSGTDRTTLRGQLNLPDDKDLGESRAAGEIGSPDRINTGAIDHTGNPIYIGDTVTLLTRSKARKFKLKRLFQKGDQVIVHRFSSGFLYVHSANDPREETTRLPINVKKE